MKMNIFEESKTLEIVRFRLSCYVYWAATSTILILLAFLPRASLASGDQLSGKPEWRIEVDQLKELTQTINRQYRSMGSPIFITGLSFDISRANAVSDGIDQRNRVFLTWMNRLVSYFEDKDFEEMSGEDIYDIVGKTKNEIIDEWIKSAPFGIRDKFEAFTPKEFHILFLIDSSRCEGGIGASIFGILPNRNVKSSFGRIGVFLFGVGGCGPGNSGAIEYVGRLRKEVQERFLQLEGLQ